MEKQQQGCYPLVITGPSRLGPPLQSEIDEELANRKRVANSRRAAKHILKEREVLVPVLHARHTLSFSKWRTIGRYDTHAEAVAAMEARQGLYQWRIFHNGSTTCKRHVASA